MTRLYQPPEIAGFKVGAVMQNVQHQQNQAVGQEQDIAAEGLTIRVGRI